MRRSVVIVGSGFAGLCMAIRLAEQGRDDFVVLEKADTLGGTWRDNTYPGCACDVQSHLYSFSFAPNPNWTRMFARQEEIRAYLEDLADRYRLRDRIRYGVTVTGAEYDAESGGWTVHTERSASGTSIDTAGGETIDCRFVVWGTGALHEPSVPEIDGLERFDGTVFHSAHWDHGHDLTGEKVAVIGTGASAIQFVPPVAERAAELTLFQRTPPWILPKVDRPISAAERWAFRAFPALQRLYRAAIYARLEARVVGFRNPALMAGLELLAKLHIRRAVADPELRRALTPDYTLGCKRVLISNDYYPALTRDNVNVVTDGIVRVTERGVVTADGAEHEVDTIIFGTGFKVADAFAQLAIVGRDGVKLTDAWRDGAEAHLGTTVAGFPNLFVLVGPNTGLSHSSMVYMIESQVAYVLDCLDLLDRRGARALDTRPERQAAYNAELREKLAGGVWQRGGCRSWYLDENGVNRTLWPDFTFRFRGRTRHADPADLVLTP
ncbi:flavin-containing monooxygenase [Pseudonocardia acaciae]|uniref:flavin-containing monooxygenase n=1 Tax=Pseudonocardia acaciae TaxID=551276 RepID=UPI000685A9E3|nr:NAD(P)/FAD-dependent oxidoreductase [Pseudonocardia acaciae]